MPIASGSICAWLSADDTYLPGAVRNAGEVLQTAPLLVAVYGQGYWVDRNERVLGGYPTEPNAVETLGMECQIC